MIVPPGYAEDAILVDEIGIETGRYGSYLLKTLYQPIFIHCDEGLLPIGVEGLVGPQRDGKPVDAEAFFADVAAEDRFAVETMCRALHLRNYRNIGIDELLLFFNCNPGAQGDLESAVACLRYMLERLGEIEIDPQFLVCEFTEGEALDSEILQQFAAEMRGHGVHLAIDDFGVGHSTLDRVRLIEPDVVKIDGGWFRQIASVDAATRLLAELVEGMKREGAQVLIEGIETPDHLRVALDAGADMLQGYLLAKPALAGTILDTAPLDPEKFFDNASGVVIPFR